MAVIGIAVVTAIGVVDHTRKTHALARASVSEWYCAHQGRQCDERKSDDIEDAWNARERVYIGMDVGFFVIAVAAAIAVNRRRE